jgi:DNA-binding CsgD family transcriptional regulator/tetratricopeptide (TPR) repeat protein
LGSARAALADGAAQLQVFQAVTAFLRELSSFVPLLMFVDDLHWADATSLALCVYLGRYLQGAPIIFLATYRDVELGRQHPLEEALRELTRERVVDQVQVRRLTIEDTAAVVVERMQGQHVSDNFVDMVYRHSEGNPFFTEELVDAFVQRSKLDDNDDQVPSDNRSEIEIPQSIRAAIDQRVSRLEPAAQDVLQLASVIGPEFDLELLQQSGGLEENELLKYVDAALRIRLLEERQAALYDTYAFTHVLIQQTLYRELSRHRARRLHLRVGEALERLDRRDPASISQLARHFGVAGDHERTIRYATAAGEQAAARHAHAEAVSNYDVALDVLEEHGDDLRAAELRRRMAGDLYDLNRVDAALAAYATALATFERYGDAQGEARAHHGIGYVHLGRYEVANAIAHFDKALQVWPGDAEDPELAELLLDSVRARNFSSHAATAGAYAERGLALAERLGNPGLLARALCEAAQCRYWQDPKPTTCMPLLDRAAVVARGARAWRVLHRVHLLQGLAHTMAGELELALAARQRALAVAQSSGEIERVAFVHYTIAHASLVLGDWESGRTAARAGLQLDPQNFGSILLAWMEGRFEETLALVRADIIESRRRDDVQSLLNNLVWLADLSLELGRVHEAEAPAREAFQLLKTGIFTVWPGLTVAPLAEVAARLRTPDADVVLAEAEQFVAESEQFIARPQLLRARGLLLLDHGKIGAAREALLASAELARQQHALLQLGRTLADLGDVFDDARFGVAANEERAGLIDRIGLETRGLSWAARQPTLAQNSSAMQSTSLSPRERQVAVLLADGLSNRQIATQLVISERTAEHHVQNILNKLGLASRSQVAAWAARARLEPR